MTEDPLPAAYAHKLADMVVRQSMEIVHLRFALMQIARLGVNMRSDFSRSADQSRIARDALRKLGWADSDG